MRALAILVVVLVPTVGFPQTWRWRQADGTLHYSNRSERVPRGAAPVRGTIGLIATPMPRTTGAVLHPETAPPQFREEQRIVRQELEAIDRFDSCVRARQIARLVGGYPNVAILPDWLVADRWLAVHDIEGRLRATLIRLEQRKGGVG